MSIPATPARGVTPGSLPRYRMEDWIVELQVGGPEAAWDRFLKRYRRLIFAAIRHYAQDYDDVMDVFARVCDVLRDTTSRVSRRSSTQSQPGRINRCSGASGRR